MVMLVSLLGLSVNTTVAGWRKRREDGGISKAQSTEGEK